MPRLPRVSAREVERVLNKLGFMLTRTRGSHHIYYHPQSGRRVTVAHHGRRIIPPGTLLNILQQIGISQEKFKELLRE
ncbi:MAG: type II toxin-antitoxin system HicA family toxin [Anaerolineae bacterium]